MKKALVVLLILAVAGGAFTEITFGGVAVGAWQVLNGTDKEDGTGKKTGGARGDDGKYGNVWTDWGLLGNDPDNTIRARLNVNATNEDGTLGAWYQFRPTEGSIGLGNIWWQPISQFKATLGYFAGGANLTAGVASVDDTILPAQFWGRAWGWNAERAIQGWGWESTQAASVELFPMESLYIAVSVPFDQDYQAEHFDSNAWASVPDALAMDTFAQTVARVAYTITDIGQIGVTWDGGTMTVKNDYDENNSKYSSNLDPAYISAHFNLTAVENLALSVVFDVPLPITKWHSYEDDKEGTWIKSGDLDDIKIQLPFTGAVQAGFTAGAFHIDGGIAAHFMGSTKNGDKEIKDPLALGVTLNPVYDVGIVKVGLVGEMLFTAAAEEGHENYDRGSKVDFNVIPYVQKDLTAGGSVFAGFQIKGTPYGDPKDAKAWKNEISWAIPVGFVYWF